MRPRCTWLIGMLISFFPVMHAHAQQAPDIDWTPRVSVEGGAMYSSVGPGATLGAGVEFGRNILRIHGRSAGLDAEEQTWDVSLLYGRAYYLGSFGLRGAAGMAIVGGYRYDGLWGRGVGEQFDPMIGFPLDGRLEWFPVDVVALGLQTFANVNTEQPFLGGGVTLRVGNLR